MGVSGISFYQQDQNYWSQAQAQSQASSADDSLINVIGTAMTDEAKGEASIANGIALKRVNSELSAAVQAALQSQSGSSSSSSSGSSTSPSASSSPSSSASSTGAAAVGVGTVPLTTGTSLSSLGILPGGTFTVTTGNDTTTYTSTGTDTIGDLIDALNIDLPTNAQVTASLNSEGQLVLAARNKTDLITVGGSGIDATAIGFGVGNDSFSPKLPSASASSSSSSSSTSSSSGSSSSAPASTSSAKSSSAASAKSSKKSTTSVSSLAEEGTSTAAGILSADGVSGSLVDMLA